MKHDDEAQDKKLISKMIKAHEKGCTCKACSGGVMQKGGIKIKPSHKGLLHKDLGVAKDKPIPAKKLEKAEHSSNPTVKKRAVFAENSKGWSHKAQGGTDDGGHTTESWYKDEKKDGPAVKANKGTFVGFKVPKATKDYSAKGPKRKK